MKTFLFEASVVLICAAIAGLFVAGRIHKSGHASCEDHKHIHAPAAAKAAIEAP